MRISDWSSDVCSSDLPQRIGDATILARGMEHRIVEDSAHRILVAVEPAEHIADLVRRAQMDGDMILAGEQARHVLHRDARVARPGRLEALPIGRAACRERVCQYV